MRRPGHWLLIAAVAVTVLGTVPVAAQEDEPEPLPLDPVPSDEVSDQFDIDDGDYTGNVGLGGAFWLAEEGVVIIWKGSGTGPMEFTVTGGELDGTWSMDGAAGIAGYGFPLAVEGKNTWTIEGSVSGSGPYMLTGSGSSTSTVSVGGQEGGGTSPIEGVATPLHGIRQVCGQVVGNWDQVIDAAFEGGPLQHSLRTYFGVFAADPAQELEERLEEVIERGSEIQSDLSRPAINVIVELSGILDDAEELVGEIGENSGGCPPDPAFMRIITQVVQDVMNTYLNQWIGESSESEHIGDLGALAGLGLRAGAIGAGAADPGVGDFLSAKAAQVLQTQYDAVISQDPIDLVDGVTVAITATMLGYTFDNGTTGSDICTMLGAC